MCIERCEPAAVVDFDIVPVATSPTVGGVGNSYGTICSSENRSTLWDSDVGTTMVANFTSNGVCAVALRRCDCACHRQWPLQSTVRENRIHAGGHEFPTPLHEATQEFTPKDCGIFS